MKLQAVKLYEYNANFKYPIVTPKIKLICRKALIIELITDTEQHYFGECNAFETDWYSTETIEVVRQQTEKWIEQYQNDTFSHFEKAQATLEGLTAYPATRSMLVMAFYQMFYEMYSFNVPYGATVSGLTEGNLKQLADTQPQRVKIKWSQHILQNIETLEQLDFQPNIAIDANESIQDDESHKLKQLANKSLLYIEEPFKSLEKLECVTKSELPPIAIDEKALSQDEIMKIIDHSPIDVVVLKPFRLGGIDKVLEIINVLKPKDIKIVIGGMYEYGLSRYFTALLAQYADYPSDITPEGYYFKNDIVNNAGILKGDSIYFEPPVVNTAQLKHVY
ncbi:o-succinylbenzoate synthase [Staphylococcus equorum]|uniref:o-succinylbenzoate synthase n=1 Tax=Staphylococcus equorum TaxID=246432 RepID=A0A9X4LCA9_9STAP|nr:o-succinylbenzoate synthase [Staphylococcus equorum]MDG0844124.1 o-succinylbenzoate synthase [Staphylococcus equorum]MDG0860436.1 o-succinylbenzoate synthase [Staphylococcus equorum]